MNINISLGFYDNTVVRTECGRCEKVVKGHCIKIYARGVSSKSYHILCALLYFRKAKQSIIENFDSALDDIYQVARRHDHNTKPKAL